MENWEGFTFGRVPERHLPAPSLKIGEGQRIRGRSRLGRIGFGKGFKASASLKGGYELIKLDSLWSSAPDPA
jgi:hypothetical protein